MQTQDRNQNSINDWIKFIALSLAKAIFSLIKFALQLALMIGLATACLMVMSHVPAAITIILFPVMLAVIVIGVSEIQKYLYGDTGKYNKQIKKELQKEENNKKELGKQVEKRVEIEKKRNFQSKQLETIQRAQDLELKRLIQQSIDLGNDPNDIEKIMDSEPEESKISVSTSPASTSNNLSHRYSDYQYEPQMFRFKRDPGATNEQNAKRFLKSLQKKNEATQIFLEENEKDDNLTIKGLEESDKFIQEFSNKLQLNL